MMPALQEGLGEEVAHEFNANKSELLSVSQQPQEPYFIFKTKAVTTAFEP